MLPLREMIRLKQFTWPIMGRRGSAALNAATEGDHAGVVEFSIEKHKIENTIVDLTVL